MWYTFRMDFSTRTIGIGVILAVVIIWLAAFRRPFRARVFTLGLIGLVGVALVDAAVKSVQLWSQYASDPVAKFYLPPHSTIVFDHVWRIGQPVFVSLIAAGVVFAVFSLAKRWLKLEQYGYDDIALLTLAAFASSWPGVLIMFVVVFVVAVAGSAVLHVLPSRSRDKAARGEGQAAQAEACATAESMRRAEDTQEEANVIRLVITPFIIPVTIAIIWFLPYLNRLTGLEKIRF